MEFRRQFTHAIVRGIPDSMALAAEGLHGKVVELKVSSVYPSVLTQF